MSTFKKVAKTDKRTKYAVYGWIRKAEQEIISSHIPAMISSVCLLYFNEEELFEIVANQIIVSVNQKVISSTDRSTIIANFTRNYGAIVIPSKSNRCCQWNLRILELEGRVQSFFGISSTVQKDPYNCKARSFGEGYHYVIHDTGHKFVEIGKGWDKYCKSMKKGDKLGIRLDLDKAELRYLINDKDQGVAYTNIAKGDDIDYRLMVSLDTFFCARIKLISFDHVSFG